ncbi:hypothetical protein ACWDKQ_22475 [Saccharopolyspora sp. NPDC000995]
MGSPGAFGERINPASPYPHTARTDPGSATGQGRNAITTSTSLHRPRRQHRGGPAPDRFSDRVPPTGGCTHAPSSVSPVHFAEPEHTRAVPEQHHPIADHSDAGMRRLRTPFETDPA